MPSILIFVYIFLCKWKENKTSLYLDDQQIHSRDDDFSVSKQWNFSLHTDPVDYPKRLHSKITVLYNLVFSVVETRENANSFFN
jgi:hypothetical protein